MNDVDPTKPQAPQEPDPADCCGSGCVRCIFDTHDDAMERYRAALAGWSGRADSDND